MLGFDALGAAALPGEESSGSVPRVNADQANFAFAGTAYAPTTDFSWGTTPAVSGNGAATLDFAADASATYTSSLASGTGAGTLPLSADASGVHGVVGTGASTLTIDGSDAAAHGIAGPAEATVGFVASASVGHGIAGAGDSSLTFTVDAAATHERYELRGEVRQGGVLVNRRVRAYLRDTGAMIGEDDTTAGRFNIHTGFAPAEHYIVPVHLVADATDWTPPVANRVLSVLAQDV